MPHLTIEVTENLRSQVKAAALLDAVQEELLASGVFDGPDIKSRVMWLSDFRIGRATGEEAFVHASLALLAGRVEAVRKQLSKVIVAALSAHLPVELGYPVQVSCEVREMNRDCYTKAIHFE